MQTEYDFIYGVAIGYAFIINILSLDSKEYKHFDFLADYSYNIYV